MKALILTYYWPPAGGSGVQRWLKFTKYLRDFGIEPIIYTVKNPNYPVEDESLYQEIPDNIEVLKQPILEPNNLGGFFSKNKKQSAGFLNPNPGTLGRTLQYIRANYFIPDSRKYWIKPSVKYLKKYIENNSVDVLISTGPPHSLHIIGLELKKHTGIKWISDFRDPWTKIDYFDQLPLTSASIRKHQKLEKEVLKNSDAVLVVGKTMKEDYNEFNDCIHVVTNGYDSDIQTNQITLDQKFSITHVGMMNSDRNPKVLWKVLSEIIKEDEEFANDVLIRSVGKVAEQVRSDLSVFKEKNIEVIDYLSHSEVRKLQQSSQVLLLAINNVSSAKGIVTGKIFEYLQAKRPILAIGPTDGDAADILKATESGKIVGFNDKGSLKEHIKKLYLDYKKDDLKVNAKNVEMFHRKKLTERLATIIKEIQ